MADPRRADVTPPVTKQGERTDRPRPYRQTDRGMMVIGNPEHSRHSGQPADNVSLPHAWVTHSFCSVPVLAGKADGFPRRSSMFSTHYASF